MKSLSYPWRVTEVFLRNGLDEKAALEGSPFESLLLLQVGAPSYRTRVGPSLARLAEDPRSLVLVTAQAGVLLGLQKDLYLLTARYSVAPVLSWLKNMILEGSEEFSATELPPSIVGFECGLAEGPSGDNVVVFSHNRGNLLKVLIAVCSDHRMSVERSSVPSVVGQRPAVTDVVVWPLNGELAEWKVVKDYQSEGGAGVMDLRLLSGGLVRTIPDFFAFSKEDPHYTILNSVFYNRDGTTGVHHEFNVESIKWSGEGHKVQDAASTD